MSEEQKLLPCPFCGGRAVITTHVHRIHGTHRFELGCDNIDCPIVECSINNYFNTKSAAITAWNTRAPDALLDEVAGILTEISGYLNEGDNVRIRPRDRLHGEIDAALSKIKEQTQ